MLAARAILSATTREKINSLRTMLQGVHPRLDTALEQSEHSFAKVEAVATGAVIELSAEVMPETTEEEKKRKKALLVFIKYWKQLEKEVERVEKELDSQNKNDASQGDTSLWAKIFSSTKGPLGIVTLLAVGIVVALQATEVKLQIMNAGCDSIEFPSSIPTLPSLSLPKEPILNQGSGTAIIPPLVVEIDSTAGRTISVRSLGFSGSYQMSSGVSDILLDGSTLLNKKIEIHLGDSKEHTLVFVCGGR